MRIENVSLDRAHLWLSASQFWTTQKLIRICQIIEIFQILSIKSSIMSIRRGSRHLENIMSDFSIIYRLPTEASPSHTITTITNLFWQKKNDFTEKWTFAFQDFCEKIRQNNGRFRRNLTLKQIHLHPCHPYSN